MQTLSPYNSPHENVTNILLPHLAWMTFVLKYFWKMCSSSLSLISILLGFFHPSKKKKSRKSYAEIFKWFSSKVVAIKKKCFSLSSHVRQFILWTFALWSITQFPPKHECKWKMTHHLSWEWYSPPIDVKSNNNNKKTLAEGKEGDRNKGEKRLV